MATPTSTLAPTAAGPPAFDGPTLRIGRRTYPVLLPRLRDPRLHVAAVIVSVQVLGQTVLGFDVSIAQILLAIGTAAVLELVITARTARVLAWPASALLTGNGVALILRTPGTVHGDWWSLRGWPIFVAAAGVSLLSKYAIRVGDRHVFNPSNFGLVVVFLVFGAKHADPQDLWWGPWRPALALTIAVIVIGGVTLAVRLRLFTVALTFWATFAAGVGVLAASGHAITARWHVGPLTDWSFWWVLVSSPEIVIFVFFMITDPRTAPEGRVARPVYAAAVGVLASVLVAFQHTEFATKVALLAALTIVCGFRPWLERRMADARFALDGDLAPRARWWRPAPERDWLPVRATGTGSLALVAVALISAGAILVAGSPNRSPRPTDASRVADAVSGQRPAVSLAADAIPTLTIDPALRKVDGVVGPGDTGRIARDLAEDLAILAEARRTGNAALARTAAFGPALDDAVAAARQAAAGRDVAVPTYALDRGRIVLLRDPVNPQAIPQLGVVVTGERTDTRFAGGRPAGRTTAPAETVFLVTRVAGHALIGRELPADTPMVVRD